MDHGDGISLSKKEQFAYEMICAFQRGEMSRKEVSRLLETTPRNASQRSPHLKTAYFFAGQKIELEKLEV